MPVIHDRYRVIRELSSTLYGYVFACEDMRGSGGLAPPSATTAPAVIKQVSLERMTSFMQDHPSEGHTPDNPIVEKEVGDIIRAAGGHPNLVSYTDSFVEKQTFYLVMEHCADGDLYATSKTDLEKTSDARPKLKAQRSGLQFVPSADGTASLSRTRSLPER
ncbi:hypothetical protein PRNP1_001616 [Phytophthora ramorum]